MLTRNSGFILGLSQNENNRYIFRRFWSTSSSSMARLVTVNFCSRLSFWWPTHNIARWPLPFKPFGFQPSAFAAIIHTSIVFHSANDSWYVVIAHCSVCWSLSPLLSVPDLGAGQNGLGFEPTITFSYWHDFIDINWWLHCKCSMKCSQTLRGPSKFHLQMYIRSDQKVLPI